MTKQPSDTQHSRPPRSHPGWCRRVIAREHRLDTPHVFPVRVLYFVSRPTWRVALCSARKGASLSRNLGSATGKIIPRNGTVENGQEQYVFDVLRLLRNRFSRQGNLGHTGSGERDPLVLPRFDKKAGDGCSRRFRLRAFAQGWRAVSPARRCRRLLTSCAS